MNAMPDIPVTDVDVLVIGGGTAGPMAAVTAKECNPRLNVLLLEKANVKRSGAICMGIDGPVFLKLNHLVEEVRWAMSKLPMNP